MSTPKYCDICGKELIPTITEKRFDSNTGEAYDLILGMRCPSNICGHHGIIHRYRPIRGIKGFFSDKLICARCKHISSRRAQGWV